MSKRKGFVPNPFNRRNRLNKIDWRSSEGMLVKGTAQSLLKQLDREPTSAERLLIDRLSIIHLRLRQLDAKILDGTIDAKEAPLVTALANCLTRGLTQLGLLRGNARVGGRPQPRLTSIADILRLTQPTETAGARAGHAKGAL
jgi:hypothetical protein